MVFFGALWTPRARAGGQVDPRQDAAARAAFHASLARTRPLCRRCRVVFKTKCQTCQSQTTRIRKLSDRDGAEPLHNKCIERSGGEELSSHVRPAPLTHCVPPRRGTRRVRRVTAQAAGAPTSRSPAPPDNAGARGPALSSHPERRPPPAANLEFSPSLRRLSLKSKWRRRVVLSSDAECTNWCFSRSDVVR